MTSKVQNTPAADTATTQPDDDGADFRIATLPRMMTIEQAANVMGLTQIDVWDLVGSGALAGARIGREKTIWLHPRDVRDHLAKLEAADEGALRTLRMMAELAGVPIDLSDVRTAADVTEAARVIAQGMSVLQGKAS